MGPSNLNIFVLIFTAFSWKQAAAVNIPGCLYQKPYPLEFDGSKQREGDIYTPGFHEDGYPNMAYCDYVINAPEGHVVKLTFKEMELEPGDFCGRDKVYVIDGSGTDGGDLGAYCGLEPPSFPIISTQRSMRLSFRTDSQIRKKGFHAHYEVILPSEICPSGFTKCRNNRCFKHSDKCNGNDDCGDGTDEENCGKPLAVVECGHGTILPIESSLFGKDRVVGGIAARPGSWPWQADLQVRKFFPNSHQCGGTLINSQWVMTALHCLMGYSYAKDWVIHLGNHKKYSKDPGEQVRYVERIVVFPGYTGEEIIGKPVDITHDIALMKLNAPVKFSDTIRPACLPPAGYEVPVRTRCIASGWGMTRGTGENDVLKQAELVVQAAANCPTTNNATMICVRSEGSLEGVCHGDSGGPLACKINNRYHVLGITSYGETSNMMSGICAVDKYGTNFNKVSAKIGWINEMIEKYS